MITRCPACGTMFKVVTDQLKVSQGWVRCGHCAEVFDASLHLQVAAPSIPPATDLSQTPQSAVQSQPLHEQAWSPVAAFADRSYSPSPTVAGSFISGEDVETDDFDPANWKQKQQASQLYESDSLRLNEQGEAVPAPPSLLPQVLIASPKEAAMDDADSVSLDLDNAVSGDGSGDVSFVRDARRKAFWRKPVVRVVLGVSSVILAALLLLQLVIQQRDGLAALEPTLTPGLQAACEYLQCEIRPLRHIEAIVIDSSSFNKLSSDAYRLGFSLKNTSATSVAMPSLEVTLTDSQDQPLLRRVLTPAQFGAGSEILGARSDFAGLVALQAVASDATGTAVPLRVAGYRVLAFYP